MKVKSLLFGILSLLFASTAALAQFPVNCIDYATISLRGGGTEIITCEGDGLAETYDFRTSTLAMPFGYLITDENNIILEVSIDNTLSFEGLGEGNFRVWAFAWLGQITAEPGQDAATAGLATICGALTTNFIPVVNFVPDGGEVALTDGSTSQFICPEDGISDVLSFTSTGDMTAGYVYLLTDENNIIIEIIDGDSYDFDLLSEGNYRVWGLAYAGDLLAEPGDDAAATQLAESCFGLSDNFIEIERALPDGGTVALEDGSTNALVCVNDGQPDVLTFTNQTQATAPYVYVITDDNNVILSIVSGDSFDFDDASAGICRVWGLSYTGSLTAMEGEDAAAADLSDGCFNLSDNFITVDRQEADGATVRLEDGGDETFACVGDGVADVISFVNTSGGADEYTYLITDTDNLILAIAPSGSFDFEGADVGICRVWGLAYGGTLLAEVGDDAATTALADGCFGLSDNFITVRREAVEGGTVAAESGTDPIFVCPDGTPNTIGFETTGTSTGTYAYVITTDELSIVGLADGNTFDFDALTEGTYYAWGLAYTGTLTAGAGDDASAVALSDECYELSGNFVTVVVETPNGGTVSTADGETTVFTCPGDGVEDVVFFDSTGTSQGAYTYVITDEANEILALPAGDSFDFDGAPAGTCRVWGLAYSGNITAAVGDIASDIALTDECFSLSENFITVIRQTPDGGTISLDDGTTETFTCPGDGMADILTFQRMGTYPGPFAYVITDEDNVILDFANGNTYDFDSAPAGTCRVWGLAYTGAVTAMVGDTASVATLSDDCFDLSDNFITVVRDVPVGGTVELEGGGSLAYICPDDSLANVLAFDSAGVVGPNFIYVVTDQQNIILDAFPVDVYDFETDETGIVRVWGLAYTGNLIAEPGDTASTATLSDDCFSLSENFVDVIREVPFGGEITTEDGETTVYTCPGDGVADIISVDSILAAITPFTYVITDENNVILDLPGGDTFDFDGAPAGNCRIWGLSYIGNITAEVGDTASAVTLADQCFDLSQNFITVVREVPEGGTVAMPDGETTIYTCPGDGIADIIMADSANTSSGPYTYVITDDNNIILELPTGDAFDLDGAPAGTCRIWGLAYTGTITANVGDDAATVALSSDCFSLSDNFITVIRETPDGGMVSTASGSETVTTCPGDGNADFVTFDSTGTAGLYVYVITDTNNVIVDLISGDAFDFDLGGIGVSRVWGLAYTGTITAAPGDNAADVPLSDDCFDLSDNFVTIVREVPNGGIVRIEGGATELYVCPGNGVPDIVSLDSAGVSGSFIYLLTDENDIILTTLTEDQVDFDPFAENDYRIYGLAYAGNLSTILIGADVNTDVLADDCFTVSDNFVAIFSQVPEGGMVMTTDGETEIVTCPGDGMPDVLTFDSTGTAGPYTYVLTDESNVIIDLIAGDSYDFEPLGVGVSRVWGLAYTGNILAQVGDDAGVVELTDDCYDLSDNFVTVTRVEPNAGTIGTVAGPVNLDLCVGDGIADSIAFEVTGASDNAYGYLITDENDFLVSAIDSVFNFENIQGGTYRVYGVSYTGQIAVLPGANIFIDPLSDDCYDLTGQFVEINAEGVDGGVVFTDFGVGQDVISICQGDGEPNVITFFNSTTATDANYIYALTNEAGIILGFVPGGNQFDFETSGTGVAQIWGISYTGNLLAGPGLGITDIQLSDGCASLSDNFITVLRDEPEGGSLTTGTGETDILVCLGPTDGTVDFVTTSGSFNSYLYLLTDESNIVIDTIEGSSFNFAQLPEGVFRIWGLSYSGLLNDIIGEDAAAIELSNSCYELSDNFLTITRGPAVDGGVLSEVGGADTVYLCPGGSAPDFVVVSTTSQDPIYRYIITNANDQVIVDDIEIDVIDFEGAMPGIYHIWGVSLEGDLSLNFGNEIPTTPASADCFQYSENFITVVYEGPEAGTVFTDNGEDEVTVTVGDTMPDLLTFITTGASQNVPYLYLITDTDNHILDVSLDGTYDFENTAVGVSRIWGLSYTGELFAFPGSNAGTDMLSDDCWDLSGNFITVNRVEAPTFGGGIVEQRSTASSIRSLAAAPNPATQYLNVQFFLEASVAPQSILRVLNSQGQLVETVRVETVTGANDHTFEVANWVPGLYVLHLQNGNATQAIKVMVGSR
ncbi:MAG: T9SS type A sorting domain-containing protein [Phaeodactylibacter sp.]|uniref:T9SS type A sorting domain-containing protein n=1 Tax=Phaeodactylibacter sp. TaxID=1940289 RepID=UPI0032EC4223